MANAGTPRWRWASTSTGLAWSLLTPLATIGIYLLVFSALMPGRLPGKGDSLGYGIYLSRFADYNLVYGSLAAVIGFLVLVYLCAAIFLFGAQAAAAWVGRRA